MVRPGICVASPLASLNSPAPMLVGIDGAKALCKAVIDVVDRSLGQCEGVAGMARACRCVRRHFDGRIRTVLWCLQAAPSATEVPCRQAVPALRSAWHVYGVAGHQSADGDWVDSPNGAKRHWTAGPES